MFRVLLIRLLYYFGGVPKRNPNLENDLHEAPLLTWSFMGSHKSGYE